MGRQREALAMPRTPVGATTDREPDTETETENTFDSTFTPARDQDEVTSNRSPDSNTHRSPPSRVPAQSKWRVFVVRAQTTFILIGSFCLFIWMGHVPLMAMILGIQYLMVKELYILAEKAQRARSRNLSEKQKAPKWYFFFVATFWMYLRFVQKQLRVEFTMNPTVNNLLGWVINQHSFIAFSLYSAGLIAFVLRLERGHLLVQFRQYAWVHLILLFVFMPSSFFVSNIFDGIIWFLLPCSLVIVNDIGAYLAGISLGRTPLIKVSPKKTWEGFFGGLIFTLIAAWYLADWMSEFKWLYCPRTDLSMGWLNCDPDDLFVPKIFGTRDIAVYLHPIAATLLTPFGKLLLYLANEGGLGDLSLVTFPARPIQLHALVMAIFASVIAPFGGFFASGLKRSLKVKDFGDSIPGHGGMTDRMDCQVVMAVFSYLYYNNYIARLATVSVGGVMGEVMQLDSQAQLELFLQLGKILTARTQIPGEVFSRIMTQAQNITGIQ